MTWIERHMKKGAISLQFNILDDGSKAEFFVEEQINARSKKISFTLEKEAIEQFRKLIGE